MKVFIEDKEIEIYEGAKIENAVLVYSKEIYKLYMQDKIKILDRHGFETLPGGYINEGQKFTIERIKE